MTNLNDWNALDEELAAVKAIARHEGYQAAIADLTAKQSEINKATDRLNEMTLLWHRALGHIRDAWQKATGQEALVKDENSLKYRPIFGDDNLHNRAIHINMPEDLDEFGEALINIVTKASDFQLLIDAFEEDPMVLKQWNQLLMMMKMRQA